MSSVSMGTAVAPIEADPEGPIPQTVLHGLYMSDIVSEEVTWLWHNRLPLGKITIFDGDPGLGKSSICLDLAARVSTGSEMPDGTPGTLGRVALMTAEDGLADTVKPRLEALGADMCVFRRFRPPNPTQSGHL